MEINIEIFSLYFIVMIKYSCNWQKKRQYVEQRVKSCSISQSNSLI
jgi:hypothetical protein